MKLLEVIEKVCPTEQGVVEAYVYGPGHDRHDEIVPDVIRILKKHGAQCDVVVNANGLNPVRVEFTKYIVSRPNYSCYWGREYEALLELCGVYRVVLLDADLMSYTIGDDGIVTEAVQCGGC